LEVLLGSNQSGAILVLGDKKKKKKE